MMESVLHDHVGLMALACLVVSALEMKESFVNDDSEFRAAGFRGLK